MMRLSFISILCFFNFLIYSSAIYSKPALEKITVGSFKSRGLLWKSNPEAPAILMLPGSGPHGPESMMLGNTTADGKNHPILSQIAKPFIDSGFTVLQLGKPGVDYFKDGKQEFYDKKMLKGLQWKDLITNAISGLKYLQGLNSEKIYILGHSQGTQVAVDVADMHNISGLILLSFSGEDLITTVKWQIFEREIEYFLKTDLDANKDNIITKKEANAWPEFRWGWKEGQTQIEIDEVTSFIRNAPAKTEYIKKLRESKWCSDGHCTRGPIYKKAANLKTDIYVFTGELDLQTLPTEAKKLKVLCRNIKKRNCFVEIFPGVQHGFNKPKPPRGHPFLDLAVGPVSQEFTKRLETFSKVLLRK